MSAPEKYLVLHTFRSYGKQLHKGDVVDASEIRSPHLRMSEGKIIPAVSSSTVPGQSGEVVETEPAASVSTEGSDTTGAENETGETSGSSEQSETPSEESETPPEVPETPAEPGKEEKKPLFRFK